MLFFNTIFRKGFHVPKKKISSFSPKKIIILCKNDVHRLALKLIISQLINCWIVLDRFKQLTTNDYLRAIANN